MREEYDFSNAKRAQDVPHLSKLQAKAKNKTLIVFLDLVFSICVAKFVNRFNL